MCNPPVSEGPIDGLTIVEDWFDAQGDHLAAGKATITGLFQPNAVQTVVVKTPIDKRMKNDRYTFSHANGLVRPKRVNSIKGSKSDQ